MGTSASAHLHCFVLPWLDAVTYVHVHIICPRGETALILDLLAVRL